MRHFLQQSSGRAEREGYSVIVGDAQRERAREVNIINSFKRRKVDGIIVRAIGRPNEKLYKELSTQWSACIR